MAVISISAGSRPTARQALSGEEGHAALLKARDEAREHIENARAKAAKAEADARKRSRQSG
jgi:hypothetical protein